MVEIQIRDQQMHEEAEFGVAAHWHYTQMGKPTTGASIDKHLSWVKELSAWKKDDSDPAKYLEKLKIGALQQHIFCFTPKGDVIDLPQHATIIDFAYHVHTELGDRCSGALVNEKMCAVDTILHSGDVVELKIDKHRRKPNPDWLSFVITEAARTNIRRAHRTADEPN
jgi:(p)ppGpp synthase/HD superfamily hydrolase